MTAGPNGSTDRATESHVASRDVGTTKEFKPGKFSRISALPCGRRTKWAGPGLLVWSSWPRSGGLAGKLQGAEKNDASAYLPASAESTQELNLQEKFVSKNLNPAVVVYTRASGITHADVVKATADARAFKALGPVHGQVTGPVMARDHKALETVIGADLGDKANFAAFVNGSENTASHGSPGLSAHVAGPAALAADEIKIFNGIDGTLLFATLGVVIVLLLLTYRSPVLWLLPIMSAGVALIVAEAVIYLLAKHAGLTVNGQSGGILVVLVLGRRAPTTRCCWSRATARSCAGTRTGTRPWPWPCAGPGRPSSPAPRTVIAGMLCLLVAESADISGLGPVAAIGIAVGLLAMITLLPALLVIFGRWMFWPVPADVRLAPSPPPAGCGPGSGGRIAAPPAAGLGRSPRSCSPSPRWA